MMGPLQSLLIILPYTGYIAHLTNTIQQNTHLINIKLHPFLALVFVTVGMLFYHAVARSKRHTRYLFKKCTRWHHSSNAICLLLSLGMPRHLALAIVFYLLLTGVLDLDRLILRWLDTVFMEVPKTQLLYKYKKRISDLKELAVANKRGSKM